MAIPDALLGPFGALVAALIAVTAFYTGRVRPGADVVKRDKIIEEKDKTIEVLRHDLHSSELARIEERYASKAAADSIESVVPRASDPPRV